MQVEDVIIIDDKKSPAPPQSVAAEYLRLIKGGGEAPLLNSQSSNATASAGAGVSARPAPQQQQGKTAPKAAGPSGKAAVQMDKLYREAKVSCWCIRRCSVSASQQPINDANFSDFQRLPDLAGSIWAQIKFDKSIVRSGMSESDKQNCAKYIEEAYKV